MAVPTAAREAVLGVGDAVTDALVHLPPGALERLGLRAGSCACVDESGEQTLLAELGPAAAGEELPGGSAANVVKGLARLGLPARLLSALGDDTAGPRYRAALRALGVDVGAVIEVRGARSPVCYCLVAPEHEGERTMRTFLGSCGDTKPAPAPGSLGDVALVHLEGYVFYSAGFAEAVASQARSEGAQVSLDLGSAELVELTGGAMTALLRGGGVDVLFANEEEACALARRLLSEETTTSDRGGDLGEGPGEGASLAALTAAAALEVIGRQVETAVVTRGARGCVAQGRTGVRADVGMAPGVRVVDTVGAGDTFASGFLSAYLRGAPLEVAARCGCLCGAQAVQVAGANIGEVEWAELKSNIDTLSGLVLKGPLS